MLVVECLRLWKLKPAYYLRFSSAMYLRQFIFPTSPTFANSALKSLDRFFVVVIVSPFRSKAVFILCPTTRFIRKLLMEMVGATGFESVFATFLIFGCVRYLVTT